MDLLLDILLWPLRKIGLIGPKKSEPTSGEDEVWATTDTEPRSFENILEQVKQMEPGESRTFWFDPEDPLMDGEQKLHRAVVMISVQVGPLRGKYSVRTGENRYLLNIRRDD